MNSGNPPPFAPLVMEWGVAEMALQGERESGDQYLVREFSGGMLLAAVDGLGHGPEAHAAARAAIEILDKHAGSSLLSLISRCHSALIGTRGAAMSLAAFHAADNTLTWMGVGNVQGILRRGDPASALLRESLLSRGGVVGYQLPSLFATMIPVHSGDVLSFATDGINFDFIPMLTPNDHPQAVADRILAANADSTDDALILVARFTESGT